MPTDFTLQDHGSIFLLVPNTADAQDWAADHLPTDAQFFGKGVAIEPRYVEPIVNGIVADGLTIA